jgi:bifunctional DNase/RNase
MTADKKFKRLVRERARRTGESYAAARRELLRKRSEPPVANSGSPQPHDLVEVRATGIRTDSRTETPFLVLKDTSTDRELLVAIGPSEATAIAFAQQQVAVPRPMTHDALKQTVDALGARLLRVVVDHQPETNTFIADVVLTVNNADELHLDWRVSDSVALAVRCDPPPPILVPERLLAETPASPAAGWSGGVRVRCACSAWIPVPKDVLDDAAALDAELIEADLECPSCGQPRHVRIERPPGPGERVLIVDSPIDPAGDL